MTESKKDQDSILWSSMNTCRRSEKMSKKLSMTELTELTKRWAMNRNLNTADPTKQMLKLMEEIGELAEAMCKGDKHGVIDGIGDALVVITVLCTQLELEPSYCLEMAYNEIKDRKGRLIDGVFVKEADL